MEEFENERQKTGSGLFGHRGRRYGFPNPQSRPDEEQDKGITGNRVSIVGPVLSWPLGAAARAGWAHEGRVVDIGRGPGTRHTAGRVLE